MYEYQKNQKYYAQVTGSIEKHAAQELTALGAKVLSEEYRGIRFSLNETASPKETLYKILYCSRLIQRILAPLMSFQCHSEKYLYQQAKNIDWTEIFDLSKSFTIITNVHNSHIDNSLYAGQILKDAICDKFKEKYDQRPNFKTKDGDVVFSLYIAENWATISYDVSGTSMHKRGYRTIGNQAPLQETIAATIVKLAGWTNTQQNTLHDPMCGSATILAEALMEYCQIPAGYLRTHTALKNMPDYDKQIWENIVQTENDKIIPLPKNTISGSDIDPNSVEIAKTNLKKLPFGECINIFTADFKDLPQKENMTIICNPPYGVRIGKNENIIKLYNEIGDFLKQKCKNSEAYILCGKKELIPALRLRAHWKKTLKNGNIETKLVKIMLR